MLHPCRRPPTGAQLQYTLYSSCVIRRYISGSFNPHVFPSLLFTGLENCLCLLYRGAHAIKDPSCVLSNSVVCFYPFPFFPPSARRIALKTSSGAPVDTNTVLSFLSPSRSTRRSLSPSDLFVPRLDLSASDVATKAVRHLSTAVDCPSVGRGATVACGPGGQYCLKRARRLLRVANGRITAFTGEWGNRSMARQMRNKSCSDSLRPVHGRSAVDNNDNEDKSD